MFDTRATYVTDPLNRPGSSLCWCSGAQHVQPNVTKAVFLPWRWSVGVIVSRIRLVSLFLGRYTSPCPAFSLSLRVLMVTSQMPCCFLPGLCFLLVVVVYFSYVTRPCCSRLHGSTAGLKLVGTFALPGCFRYPGPAWPQCVVDSLCLSLKVFIVGGQQVRNAMPGSLLCQPILAAYSGV